MNTPSHSEDNGTPISRRRLIFTGMNVVSVGLLTVAGCVQLRLRSQRAEINRKIRGILEARQIPRSSPETLSNDPEILALLTEHFEVIAGNASIEEAQVIGIGEKHHSFGNEYGATQQDKIETFKSANVIGRLLGEIVEDGDRLLIESIDRTHAPFKLDPLMVIGHPWMMPIHRKDLTVSGWDDMETRKDTSIPLREGSLLRNERGMIPALGDHVQNADFKIHIVAGVGHFMDDVHIDRFLDESKVPYLLLAEKYALKGVRADSDVLKGEID